MSTTLPQPPIVAPGVPPKTDAIAEWFSAIQKQVGSLRFGVVQIVVHDGRIVQIERTEKFRFEPNPSR